MKSFLGFTEKNKTSNITSLILMSLCMVVWACYQYELFGYHIWFAILYGALYLTGILTLFIMVVTRLSPELRAKRSIMYVMGVDSPEWLDFALYLTVVITCIYLFDDRILSVMWTLIAVVDILHRNYVRKSLELPKNITNYKENV